MWEHERGESWDATINSGDCKSTTAEDFFGVAIPYNPATLLRFFAGDRGAAAAVLGPTPKRSGLGPGAAAVGLEPWSRMAAITAAMAGETFLTSLLRCAAQ